MENRVLLSAGSAAHAAHLAHVAHVNHLLHAQHSEHARHAAVVARAAARAAKSASGAAVASASASPAVSGTSGSVPAGTPNNLEFHGDAARTGFNENETVLTPSNVASSFGQLWQSPKLDGAVYATPLYADNITISGNGNAANHAGDGVQSSSFQNQTLGIVFAATGGGTVYAIAAQDTNGTTGIAPGTILWKTHLGNAYAGVDGNSIGVLSTPIIDLSAGRMYVTASVTDYLSSPSNPNHGGNNFEVFALNLKDGSLVSGWPLIYTQALLDSLNQNNLQGPNIPVLFSSSGADQRGALNLSADGSTLYVDYACYGSSNPGWMTTVATGVTNGVANGQTPAIVSAYSSVDNTAALANGGMWGAGGPSIDAQGNVFVSTGDSPPNTGNPAGDWGNSVLEFAPGQTLKLIGVYTPWNYNTQDTIDSDLGGGSPIVVTLPAGSSTTTDLVATGGKQGNAYLLDGGNNLNNPTQPTGIGGTGNGVSPASYPASLTARPPAGATGANQTGVVNPDQDPSLYDTSAAGNRTYWQNGIPAQPGPLALFGPYNESSASGNTAKARDTPTTFTGPDGSQYVIWAGASKSSVGSSTPVAPSLYTTKIVHSPGQSAYLQTTSSNTAVMSNPGAGLVTGNGTSNEIYWVVDAGVQRTDSLTSFANGVPTLYAYDPITMQPIWSSSFEELNMGGKYNSVAVARGNLFVGTDRIQAFGLTGNTIVDDAVIGTGANQFNYSGTGWQHITGSSTMGTFDGTMSKDVTTGDSATLSFTGSAIKVYADEASGYGSATFTIDGGSSQTVALTPSVGSPNGSGSGDVQVYTITGLGAGTHTLKIVNAGGTIDVDRVEIVPTVTAHSTLAISATEGNVLPSAGGPINYTINFTNEGSIINNTGVAANGVVITDTVGANTHADLSASTPGWTLVSGNGSAGSVYQYNVGSMAAGTTGSLVFTVDLNASIPPGTPTVTNSFSISDTAGDNVSNSRVSPIPPAAEFKLIFTQQPPATGSAGIPLSPAVQVTAQDQFGNTYTPDSSTTVTLTLSGPGNPTFSTGLTTATATVSNGVATFNNLIINTAGTGYTLTATDGTLQSTVSSSFSIANTAKLGFTNAGANQTQQPTQTVAGHAISPAVKVGVEDAAGNIIGTDTSTVVLTINHGQFGDGSTTETAQAINGVATFNNLVIDATGSYTLTASDGQLTTAQSNSFNVIAQASKLVFSQQPNDTYLGEAINPSVGVSLVDQFGNVDTANVTPVTVTLNGGGGATFFGGGTSATVTPVNGVASFNNLVVTATGTYTLTATASGLTSTTSFNFTIGTHALTTIDDDNANNTGGTPQVVYSNPTSRWVQTATGLAHNFDGTITSDTTIGDSATVTFNGTLVTVYAALSTVAGSSADIFLDGNYMGNVSTQGTTAAIAPVYTSPLLTAGSHTLVVKVTGGTVSLDKFVVGPATPTLFWATPADLTYGQALDGTELDAFVSNFANFPGTFTYTPAAGTMLHAGANQQLHVVFTPQDSTDYASAEANVLVNVNKATPLIQWFGPESDLIYGQALGPSTLDATATVNGVTVPGNFVYTPAAGTVPPTGDDFPLHVDFTPTDTADYNSVSADADVDVDPATPVITWANPADITDGTPLSSAQLDATANVPGTFTYNPAAGTILPVGQAQQLGVTFVPTDQTNYTNVSTTALINVVYGPAAKLTFTQQPTAEKAGVAMTPAVLVAVQDSAGTTLPSDNSMVTLTLSSGTFSTGQSTVTVQAVNGVATFNNLIVNTAGTYTLTATDSNAGIPSTVSNQFNIGSAIFDSFNNGVGDYNKFTFTDNNGTTSVVTTTPLMTFSGTGGIFDQDGPSAGGGIVLTANGSTSPDETATYQPSTTDLSDDAVHTVSEFYKWPGSTSSGDRDLQVGLINSSAGGFNANYNFISARLLGNKSVEFQYANGGSATSSNNTAATGTINTGDWLQLIFTTQETASGAFQGTFSLVDWGQQGIGVPVVVLNPVSYSVSGVTNIGLGQTMFAGFRSATGATVSGSYDNFMVDPQAANVRYLSAPSSAPAGGTLGNFVVSVQDALGNVIPNDTSTITITLSHGTFSDGKTSESAQCVDGVATFTGLVINAVGSYSIRCTDSNPNLDPGFDIVTINGGSQVAVTQQPVNTTAGVAMSSPVKVSVEDPSGGTVLADNSTVVTLTLSSGTFSNGQTTATATAVNGVATFSGLTISSAGTYTLTASAPSMTSAVSNAFTVASTAAKLGFIQQPPATGSEPGVSLTPPVTVAIQDAAGRTVTNNTSTVTLTLNGGTFVGGGTTTSVAAVGGIATFPSLQITSAGAYTLTATDGSFGSAISNPFAVNSDATTSIDDRTTGTGNNQVNYAGTWTQTAQGSAFQGTISTINTTGGTATLKFNGVQFKFYGATRNSYGMASIKVDGTTVATVDEYSSATTGNVLLYTSSVLTPGNHTVVVSWTGTKNASSSGTTISVDRFDVIKAAPTVTWSAPASIVYGTALSGTQLNATATYNGSTVPGTFVYSPTLGTVLNAGANQTLTVEFVPTDPTTYASVIKTTTITVTNSTVAARQVFYNNSKFDQNDPTANANDDAAIATDKTALLPGQTATFANYTSYSRGINGIMVDIAKLPNGGSGVTAADFTFAVGNGNTPGTWAAAPAPTTVLVRPGAGVNGSDRVELIWADNAIQKEWLQVTVLATANTGLANNDVFYFGNAIGETGNSSTSAAVDTADDLGARSNKTGLSSAPITDVYDFNRDGKVDTQDELIARSNHSGLAPLKLISVPLPGNGADPNISAPSNDKDVLQ